jgi:hypothetical protein
MFARSLQSLALLLLCVSAPALALELEGDWNKYRSEHFLIYSHPSIPNKYISEFSQKSERYYHQIRKRLGFARFTFWLWQDRARVFIYRNKREYLKASSQPRWSVASVHTRSKLINTFYFEKDFFDTTLPHELSHIILREFIGFDTRVPLWFEEGVACINENDSRRRYLLLAQGLSRRKRILSLAEIERQGRRGLEQPEAFYTTSASLVIFLLEACGRENFVRLCRQLRNGNSFYAALNKVYRIKDRKELEIKFLAFLESKD